MPEDRPIEDSPPIGEAQTDQTEGGCPAGFGKVKPPVAGGSNRDWWPDQPQPEDPAEEPRCDQPAGRGLRLRHRGAVAGRRRGARRHHRRDAHLAGMVALRLRPLRPVLHPHDLARHRHLPRAGRTWRWWHRYAAFRPAEQLARQRQPGQGPPPAVARQAEVRQEPLLGRPAGLRRQRRAGGHGLPHRRFRVRSRGPLGAGGGRLLGSRAGMARRQALHR